MAQDPTREELLAFVAPYRDMIEADDYDVECALYWLASHWHGGQNSNLYAVLCNSPYKPGAIEEGPEEDSNAADIYKALEEEFCAA